MTEAIEHGQHDWQGRTREFAAKAESEAENRKPTAEHLYGAVNFLQVSQRKGGRHMQKVITKEK
jgi:hypothetical protein